MSKKTALTGLLAAMAFLLSCATADFVKTGPDSPPLPENADVKVFLTGRPAQKYTELGYVTIRTGNLKERIEKAKLLALKNGGNALMPKQAKKGKGEPGTEDFSASGIREGDIYSFLVLRLISDMGDAAAGVMPPKEGPVKKEGKSTFLDIKEDSEPELDLDAGPVKAPTAPKKDYGNLPKATYRQLLEEGPSLKGEMFRGSLYPRGFYKIPRSLRALAGRHSGLVMMTTRSGKSKVLLLVPNEIRKRMGERIGSGDRIDFIYSPVDVYRSGKNEYPVIRFVEEVGE